MIMGLTFLYPCVEMCFFYRLIISSYAFFIRILKGLGEVTKDRNDHLNQFYLHLDSNSNLFIGVSTFVDRPDDQS